MNRLPLALFSLLIMNPLFASPCPETATSDCSTLKNETSCQSYYLLIGGGAPVLCAWSNGACEQTQVKCTK
ncbi:hypothetical protein [Legionella sp. km772]|uniref:hypothetical protein n=1 Tax=Legionella sp. km772 TaxID=2498111 RepID=UPI000F8CA246|nr:hypothetical protein [Legionella sp. km772]RUR12328.1 hypothetical protein ELY15_05375 [Legionella sp. km772]